VSAFPELPREIAIDDEIVLRSVFETTPEEMYALIARNLDYLGEFLPFATPAYSLEDARKFAEQARSRWGQTGAQGFSIFFEGNLAGTVGVSGFDSPNRAATIGYWLSQDVQGRGIMTRCVAALISLAFDAYDLNQVVIRAAPENTRSRAIPERLGFTQVGIERQWSVNGKGELLDLVTYSLLKSEWEERR
jgi:ribosomal-protein-serine acetyltransferase